MKKAIVFCCAGLFLAAGGAVPHLAAANKAAVYLVHGLPGQDIGKTSALPVDITFNDVTRAKALKLAKVSAALSFDPGSYSVKVYEAGTGGMTGAIPLITATVVLGDAENATVIIHLSAAKKAALSKFTNDFSKVANGWARFIVHHTASGSTLGPCLLNPRDEWGHPWYDADGMDNGNKALVEISPAYGASYSFQVWEFDWDPATLFRKTVPVQANKVTLIYIIGTPKTDTFNIVTITKSVK